VVLIASSFFTVERLIYIFIKNKGAVRYLDSALFGQCAVWTVRYLDSALILISSIYTGKRISDHSYITVLSAPASVA
jgi:hypothetical protein